MKDQDPFPWQIALALSIAAALILFALVMIAGGPR